jgi:hypothetical protein
MSHEQPSPECGPRYESFDTFAEAFTATADRLIDRHFEGLEHPERPRWHALARLAYGLRKRTTLGKLLGWLSNEGRAPFGIGTEDVGRAIRVSYMVRYFDTFLDRVFWPRIPELATNLPEGALEEKLNAFLRDGLRLARSIEPGVPPEIIELP